MKRTISRWLIFFRLFWKIRVFLALVWVVSLVSLRRMRRWIGFGRLEFFGSSAIYF